MDLKDLKNLIKMVDESNVNEVEIEQDNAKTKGRLKIKISKSGTTHAMAVVQHSAPMAMPHHVPTQHLPPPAVQFESQETIEKSKSERPSGAVEQGNFIEVKSPIVGTFYRSPAPDADVYVQVGSSVKPGQTLCIIEAMKIMNEIESETSGKIAKILVENGQPVEYNQTLFLIEKA